MSDFIFSKKSIEKGILKKEIQKIYHNKVPHIQEFHGEWGSLAVSKNTYNGFDPYETKNFIFVVIGGPLLYFRDNKFLNENNSNTATKAIYERWYDNIIKWDEDLSGPYAILIINKSTSDVEIVTDLMSFIPIFIYKSKSNIMVSTHVDMLSSVSKQKKNIDIISSADFVLHSVITFPYTMYKNIYQINPASIYKIINNKIDIQAYWLPKENIEFKSINEAANELRNGLKRYVNCVTSEVNEIAQFISGGEDSRVLSALLQGNPRKAFVFLDQMNREGKMAAKAANVYGADFNLGLRNKTHYLDILPESCDLVGSGSQYKHAHTYGFHESFKLDNYSAVFGGLLSDALLKGSHVKKIRGSNRFPFLPDFKKINYSSGNTVLNKFIDPKILEKITERRNTHLSYVKTFRGESAEEWFELWPSSMNMNIPNLHANRRLFSSYEPFMANDIVKLSAAVPQEWKLNRRLFCKAAKPLLRPTKWLFHSDGRLPYFPWYINIFVQLFIWIFQQFGKRLGIIKGNQGPWAEWDVLIQSKEWREMVNSLAQEFSEVSSVFNEKDLNKIFKNSNLKNMQKVNLTQVLYQISKCEQ